MTNSFPTRRSSDLSASYVVDTTDNFSQDIHVSGSGDRLTWLVGAEMLLLDSDFSVTTTRTPTLANPSPGNIAPARLHFESYAAYGSLGFDITDSLNLRSEEHTSELQSLMRISYAVFCLKKKKTNTQHRKSIDKE